MNRIEELLERRDDLSDIASILYGDLYVCEDKFWGSPTEKEMFEVEEELDLLGWNYDISDEEQALSEMIMTELKQKGIFPENEEE